MDRSEPISRARTRLLLATASLAALLVGAGAPAAYAAGCVTQNGGAVAAVTNTAAITCINIENGASVTGNVTNTSTGMITGTGDFAPTRTGITINNATVGGAVVNSGSITAGPFGAGIVVGGSNAVVADGIINSGTISAGEEGIDVAGVTNFADGISNSGTISAGHTGILVDTANGVGVASFSGGISNSGTISAGGEGIAVGDVTNFAGGISNSGTISASVAGIDVAGVTNFAGGISNSGTISASRAGIAVGDVTNFAGVISNSGTISASVAGIDVGGVTNFADGISNSGTISAGHTGIVVFDVTTFAGGIGNSGTISAGHTGILVDTANGVGVASFSGGITNTGTISGVTGIVVTGSGAVSVFDSGVIFSTNGTAVDLSGNAPGNTFTLGPGYSITGKVLGQGSDTFQLGGTGAGSFDLSTIGGGLQYEGFTTFNVVSGTWTVSNTFGQSQAWNVNGGTLAGTGTLQSVNVNSGGTLEPGTIGQPGTIMTINGNLTFQPGAAYLVNIGPTTASRANVSGAVTLNGAAVQGFLTAGSYNKNTTYDILDPSSISGTFSGFTALNAPGFGGTLTYNDNTDVLLNLTAQIGAGGGLNANQQNVANVINTYFNNGGTLPADFFPAFGANPGGTLSQLDGEDATGAQTSAFQSMTEFLNLILDPSSMGGGGGGGPLGFAPEQQASLPPDVALAYASILKAPPPASFAQRWTAWGSAFGGSSTSDGNAAVGSNNLTASDYGFAGGMEYHVDPSTLYGFALAGGGLNWGLANALGTGRADTFQGGVYGKHYFGAAYVSGAFGLGNDWFSTNRMALGEQLTASFAGQSYALRFEGGYRYGLPANGGAAGVTPYAALQTQWFHTPAYSESGGALALAYNEQTANDTRTELGARFDDLTTLNATPLILRGQLAWAHDFVSDPSLGAAFASLPGSAFTVYGAPIPHDTALTSASAQWLFTPNWSFTAKFDGDFASGYALYAGSGTLRYTW